MLFNQVAKGRFSAIAASSNPTLKRDCANKPSRSPSIPRYKSQANGS